jgi:hypothetical protein
MLAHAQPRAGTVGGGDGGSTGQGYVAAQDGAAFAKGDAARDAGTGDIRMQLNRRARVAVCGIHGCGRGVFGDRYERTFRPRAAEMSIARVGDVDRFHGADPVRGQFVTQAGHAWGQRKISMTSYAQFDVDVAG